MLTILSSSCFQASLLFLVAAGMGRCQFGFSNFRTCDVACPFSVSNQGQLVRSASANEPGGLLAHLAHDNDNTKAHGASLF